MNGIDVSQINQDNWLGQAVLFLIVFSMLLKEARGLIRSPKKIKSERHARIMADELATAKKELAYTREIYRSIIDWQMTARELIRLLRVSQTEEGIPETPKIQALLEKLRDIENREINGVNSESQTLE